MIHVELDLEHWHGLLEFGVVATRAIYSFGDIFEHKVEVHFIFLVTIGIKVCFQIDDVWMGNKAHDLQFSVLEPLVLQDLLDGNIVTGFCFRDELCLEDDTEGAVSDDFAVCIGNVHCVTRLSFGGDDFDNLPGVVDGIDLDTVYW